MKSALARLKEMRQERGEAGPNLSVVEAACLRFLSSAEFLSELPVTEAREIAWNQAAADVLDIMVKADAPLLHTALVAALAQRGHSKAAACKAIADCQRQRWTQYNLTTGYVLTTD